MRNTSLTIQYRDGGNSKFYETVVLPGVMPEGFAEALTAACQAFDGEGQFEPTAVGLPAPFPWIAGAHLANPTVPYLRDEDVDSDFCTVTDVSATDAYATSTFLSPAGLLVALRARYHAAA